MLQQPQDETDWAKVEQLRIALLNVLQGEEDMMLPWAFLWRRVLAAAKGLADLVRHRAASPLRLRIFRWCRPEVPATAQLPTRASP